MYLLIPLIPLLALLLTVMPLYAGLAYPGFTGHINTPSAYVTQEGQLDAMVNNQHEYRFGNAVDGRNTLFSIGLFPHVELGGRHAVGYPKVKGSSGYADWYTHNDLSGNLKIHLPLNFRYLPDLAIGMQDFGGLAAHFSSRYLVASLQYSGFTLSAGYRSSDLIAPGAFAAARWRP
ncbi:MAG: YjbH domain-containing protein, partial [Gammaproteobacteria bacterium]|nr:YjbH domain-containing protein [Gammaproteobacteria bacterium]